LKGPCAFLDSEENITMNIKIRNESVEDIDSITRLTAAAFEHEEHSSHTEQFIVNALRRSKQLTVSLVAVENGEVVGHVAISPVRISSGATGWFGLGPISVWPERHGRGIGSALMTAALEALQRLGGAGCVVLGDPGYYGRFGFKAHPGVELPGVPPEYFQAQAFAGELPTGTVQYHEAFEAIE
jgi:putative acetyltransferase